MKKFILWIGIVLGGLFVLIVLAGLALYPIGMRVARGSVLHPLHSVWLLYRLAIAGTAYLLRRFG